MLLKTKRCIFNRFEKLSFLTYTNQINNGNIFIAPATPIKKKVISILFFL